MPIKSILIVDDSPTDRQFLSDLLSKNGYKVSTAENADEALAKAKSLKPDLVLMDVVMPGQSGFQATRALSRDEATKQIPVIICTSKSQQTDRDWGMKQGARDYVVKPVKGPELLAKISARSDSESMAEQRLSLRDYQRQLAERLRQADSARSASKLGMQVGAESWLIDLVQAGEVIPVPAVSPVPLTRPWLRGVSNVRGNLYSVVDFAAFLGAGSVVLSEQSRLVLLGDRYRSAAALLVDRLLGLRNPNELRPRARDAEAAAGASPWLRAEYDDEAGGRWKELDVAELVRHADFLSVAQ